MSLPFCIVVPCFPPTPPPRKLPPPSPIFRCLLAVDCRPSTVEHGDEPSTPSPIFTPRRAMAAMDLRVTHKFDQERAAMASLQAGESTGDGQEVAAIRKVEDRLSSEMKAQSKVSAMESEDEKKEEIQMHVDHTSMMHGVKTPGILRPPFPAFPRTLPLSFPPTQTTPPRPPAPPCQALTGALPRPDGAGPEEAGAA